MSFPRLSQVRYLENLRWPSALFLVLAAGSILLFAPDAVCNSHRATARLANRPPAPQNSSRAAQAGAGGQHWRLATDDTEVELGVAGGTPVLEALRSKATHRNWLAAAVKESLMKSIQVGGASHNLAWHFEGGELDAKGEQLTLHYSSADPKLSLDSVWRARPGRGPVEHWVTIANETGQTIMVTQQESLTLAGLVAPAGQSAQAWWINRGASNATLQGGTFTVPVDADFNQVIVPDTGNPSSPVPWMNISIGDSEGLYVGWEFSGLGNLRARTTGMNPTRLELGVGLAPDFRTDIPAGETYLAPAAFVGCYKGDIDDGSYSLHRFILDKLLPPIAPHEPYPTLAYNLYLDVGGNKATESDVLNSAAFCQRLGFETFVPDAMWFPKLGDWRWDPPRFPHGEQPIEQYVHEHGMFQGLWAAWTYLQDSVDPDALNLFRHPDWVVDEIKPEWRTGVSGWGTQIDLGCDPARDWAVQETQKIVGEYKLDFLKHDGKVIATQCVQTNHRHHYGVDVSYWATLGYYHVMEALKQRYPNLMLEGCSGGAHVKDFGYVQHVHYIVTTDTLSSLPDRQSIWESTFAIPPAVLMAYTYENHYNKDADRPRPYFWRSAMMSAWQIDPTHTADWSPEDIAGAQHAVENYKAWIRPMLMDVEVHHILPRPDGFHWDGMFYWSPSQKRGTLYIFRPNNDQANQRIRLRGLTAVGQYRVHSEDGSVAAGTRSGQELMSAGIMVKLPDKFTSDLIYVETAP